MTTPQLPRWSRWMSQWWNQASLYLPVALMGLLALASYWVVSRSPAPEEPRPPRPLTADPDYFMREFAVRTFTADGQLRTEIEGSELRHYPADRMIHVDQARLHSINEQGHLTTARAQRLITNDAQTFYQLLGEVTIVREGATLTNGQRLPRLEFRGEIINYDVNQEELRSDQPVLLIRDRDQMQADSMVYHLDRAIAVMDGRVRVTLQAQP